MKRSFPILGACLLYVLFLAGCAQYSLVKAGSVKGVGKGMQVAPRIDWSMSKNNNIVTWTVDGPILQKMFFFPGVEDGKPLLKLTRDDDQKMPVFSSTMTPIEVMDLIEATLSRMKAQSIKQEKIAPAPFGKLAGFRLNFSFVSEEGLDYKGFAAGTIHADKLYLILYTGTNVVYYDKCIEEVESIVESVEIRS